MDDEIIPVFIIVGMIIAGAFFAGRVLGHRDYTKPCNQFTQWQYEQKLEPARCVK